jgi:hypothetical protein
MPVDEMVDVIETDQTDKNEVDGDDVIEEPRHDQNQNAGNDGDKRRDMGSGDDHDFSFSVLGGSDGANGWRGEAGKARQHG